MKAQKSGSLSEIQKSKIISELEKSGLSFTQLIVECKRISESTVPKAATAIFNEDDQKVIYGKKSVVLSPKEFGIFNLLYVNQDTPISRKFISKEIWKVRGEEKFHSIDVCMGSLRTKLTEAKLPFKVNPVIGVGYVLEEVQ